MAFIPGPPGGTHPRARALAQELESVIERVRSAQPQLSDAEVAEALAVVRQRHGVGRRGRVVALALAVIVAGGVAALVSIRGDLPDGGAGVGVWGVVAILAAVMVVVRIVVASRRS